MNLTNILNDIKIYIEEHNGNTWTPGKDWIQYAGPYFTSDEYVRAVKTLLEGWLVLGKDAIEFERSFPKELGKECGILVNSGSSANLIAVNTLKILAKTSKIITPVAGFPTTINPIIQCGFTPEFIDIELPSLNLNLKQLNNTEGEALIFAHALGNPVDMDKIDKKLFIIEDCCDALGSTYKNKLVGSWGDISTCSFYPAHTVTGGEGGFVATKTKELEDTARSFREWVKSCNCIGKEIGLSKKGKCGNRFSNWLPAFPEEIFDHKYVYDTIGYNLKPIELQASILIEQLKKLPEIIKLRKRNFNLLYEIFSKYEEFFYLPEATKNSDPCWFVFPLTIKEKAPFNRAAFCSYLEEHKIQTRPYFAGNILLHPAYSHLMSSEDAKKRFPVATYVTFNTFFLGVSPVITPEQIFYIDKVVERFFK